jgi:hypothetical protein
MLKRSSIFLLLLLFAVSCSMSSENGEPICTTDVRPGIEVRVKDADTGEIISNLITGRLVDENEGEEKMVQSREVLSGAFEKRGTYSIILEADQYKSWFKDGVEVIEGPCHVQTVKLTAEMQKL